MRFTAVKDEISEVDGRRHRTNCLLCAQLSENTYDSLFGRVETQVP